MDLNIVIELVILIVVIIQFIVIIILLAKNRQGSQEDVLQKLIEYDAQLDKNKSGIESSLRDEFGRNRGELSLSLKTVSEQLSTTITNFTGLVDNKIKSILDSSATSSKLNRDELNKTILTFEEK